MTFITLPLWRLTKCIQPALSLEKYKMHEIKEQILKPIYDQFDNWNRKREKACLNGEIVDPGAA